MTYSYQRRRSSILLLKNQRALRLNVHLNRHRTREENDVALALARAQTSWDLEIPGRCVWLDGLRAGCWCTESRHSLNIASSPVVEAQALNRGLCHAGDRTIALQSAWNL